MSGLKKYLNKEEFLSVNGENFTYVQQGASLLKRPEQLGMGGIPYAEAEQLSYTFLDLINKCSDLMLGLAASAASAKSRYKKAHASAFYRADGRVKDKEFAADMDDAYQREHDNHDDLDDLFNYLKMKREDFDKAHYYYKQMLKRD